jgi:hypothetical protein
MPTDDPADQTEATGLNAFAIWAKTVTGAAPKVYGLGAMEAFFALPENQISTFYLAQIERQYAGKWLDIDLWDPGDTGSIDAALRILIPSSAGNVSCNGHARYTCATFYMSEHTADETSIPAAFSCGPGVPGSNSMTSITTSTGGGAIYNGQWLRLCVQVPTNYTAPQPSGEPAGGWWKIQYDMGTGNSPATDLTTWKVTVRDNPVHLVTE